MTSLSRDQTTSGGTWAVCSAAASTLRIDRFYRSPVRPYKSKPSYVTRRGRDKGLKRPSPRLDPIYRNPKVRWARARRREGHMPGIVVGVDGSAGAERALDW